MIVLFAAKSFAITGGTLLILRFMRGRSASDRSWIAHLGLAALVALPLGSVLLPPMEVTASCASGLTAAATTSSSAAGIAPITPASSPPIAEPGWAQTAADWLLPLYAAIALFLIALTLLALLRLVLFTARARAVTDDHWLKALARARQRIELTKGPAMLVSREIASPVSWGVLRPKILLNTDAIAVHADADAIVAHELAHLARADWAKLVLARTSVALFCFNPFAWLLVREAHQLREEAADDAVLAANVEDTAYAGLLVSAARRQSNSRLLGAHGVAPTRSSLAKRVRRVLDRGLNRSAGGTRWTAAMALCAAALTAPLTTVQFTDTTRVSSVPAQDVVTFDLRVPERGPSAVAAPAIDAGAQSKASAEQSRISGRSPTAERPLQGGRE